MEVMVKNHRRRQLTELVIIALAVVLVAVYIKFFNGSIVYISIGFGNDELFKIKNKAVYSMETSILLSDSRNEYESLFGRSVWNNQLEDMSFDDYAKEQVKSKLIRVKCMNIMAKEKGVVLSRSEREAVSNAVDKFLAGVTEEQKKQLKITKSKLTDMFTEFAVAKLLYQDMTDKYDYEISTDEARVINIQYICTDNAAAANEAKSRVDSGEVFYVVAKDYNPENYECELRRNEMEESFEKVAFDLRTGETSDIISAGDKYYIIKCSSDNDNTKTEANKLELIEKYKLEQFNKEFESYEAVFFVEVNKKKWNEISTASSVILSVSFEEIYNEYFN